MSNRLNKSNTPAKILFLQGIKCPQGKGKRERSGAVQSLKSNCYIGTVSLKLAHEKQPSSSFLCLMSVVKLHTFTLSGIVLVHTKVKIN